jgi:hypothetical protein
MRIHSLRLPFQVDPAALKHDLMKVSRDDWVSHYNQSDYEANWSGVALRSRDGSTRDFIVRGDQYLDTPLLAATEYFCTRSALGRVPAPPPSDLLILSRWRPFESPPLLNVFKNLLTLRP